jgi:hypothetical protein
MSTPNAGRAIWSSDVGGGVFELVRELGFTLSSYSFFGFCRSMQLSNRSHWMLLWLYFCVSDEFLDIYELR